MADNGFAVMAGGVCAALAAAIVIGIALFTCYEKSHAQTINPGESINIEVKCQSCPECPVCPAPPPCPACPTPAPTPVPTPIPTPTPTQPPVPTRTIDFACSTYWNFAPWGSLNSTQLANLNKYRAYCDIVLTWWYMLPEQDLCPYLRNNSTIKACGPYDNWGYMSSANNSTDSSLGWDLYNTTAKQWQLRTSSGTPTMNMWTPNEAALDWGNPAFVQFYIDFFKQVPANVRGGRWKGTFAERKWNLRELDNFVIRTINNWAWNNTPVNPRTGLNMTNDQREADVLKAMQAMRADADANGIKFFANVFSDFISDYFTRPIYPQLMNLVDYAFFEVMVSDMQHKNVSESVWITRAKIAQAIGKNTKAIPVITTEYGNFWYNVATMLLTCTPGKCMVFQQPIMTDDQIEKLTTLDLGTPLADFGKAGCYVRAWTKGLVVVNPQDSGSCTVALSGSYTDLETGQAVSGTYSLQNKRGKIFTK